MKQRNKRCDYKCLKLLDQRKQDTLQWLQNQSQTKVWREICINFRNKRRKFLKQNIKELETKNKNKVMEVIYRFTDLKLT
jgi:hypothetical protein